jgi:hypothetical protein
MHARAREWVRIQQFSHNGACAGYSALTILLQMQSFLFDGALRRVHIPKEPKDYPNKQRDLAHNSRIERAIGVLSRALHLRCLLGSRLTQVPAAGGAQVHLRMRGV